MEIGTQRRTEVLRPGQVASIPAGTRYRLSALPGPAPTVHIIRIRNNGFSLTTTEDIVAWGAITALEHFAQHHSFVLPLGRDTVDALGAVTRQMADEYSHDRPYRRAMLKACVLQLLALIERDPHLNVDGHDGADTMPGPSGIRRALEYMAIHYADPITVEDLAKVAGMSRSRFQAVLKKQMGHPAKTYLTRYRVGLACRWLKETDETILAIASSCGFESPSCFYSAFKRVTGQTPAAWRRGKL
jgi:AraC-like DNA-binding protein